MYTPRAFPKREQPYKFLTLSFDDGVRQDIRFIKMLDERGLKCTFNLNSGLFGTKHDLITPDFTVDHTEVEAHEVADIYGDHEIAVHTVTHPRLDLLDEEGVLREVLCDHKELCRLSGQDVIGMAYPGGPYYTEETKRILREKTPIRYARAIKSHHTFELPRDFYEWQPTTTWREEKTLDDIKRFTELEATEDSLFYIFGHSYEFDIADGWSFIERILDLMAGHKDITYCTNGEIYKYITEVK